MIEKYSENFMSFKIW